MARLKRAQDVLSQKARKAVTLEETLEDILSDLKEDYEFRSMMAFFVDRQENAVSRYSIEEIYAGTLVPGKKITAFTVALKEKDILRETESQGFVYYSLTNRDLKEILYKILKLGDFEGRKKKRCLMTNRCRLLLHGKII